MKNARPIIIILLIIVVAAGGCYYYTHANASTDALTTSGTIDSVTVDVSSETSGKVKQVLVNEGQTVKKGDPIFILDDSLLNAQRAVAVAQLDATKAGVQTAQNALTSAQSQYQITLQNSLAQDKKNRLQDWFSDPDQFEQPGWYYSREEQLKAMQAQVDVAKQVLDGAQAKLDNVSKMVEPAKFLKAEQRLLNARLLYLVAKDVNNRAQNSATRDTPNGLYNRTHCGTNKGYFVTNARITNEIYKCTGDEHLGDAGRTLYNDAQQELEDAQKAYNLLLDSEAADAILGTRAEVSVAQERYYSALDYLREFQTGDQSIEVIAAQAVVDQAQASVDQAQKAVDQAQANVDLIGTQLAKLKVVAPQDGVVLTRNVEPGEFVQPGAAVITMADLKELTITVYIPEDRYGQLFLGQHANVTVDSFPGETFTSEVFYISDQAEFTPRNVQTIEGRKTTVFAVKLKLEKDVSSKFKPGMPADVSFGQK